MAEDAVAAVVELIAKTAASMVVEQVSLLKNVGKEMTKIKDEFRSMHALLRDADAKEDTDERVKAWVKEVRDVANETQDMINDFAFYLDHQPEEVRDVPHGSCIFIRKQLQKIVCLLKDLKTRHQMANRIQDIRCKVQEIARRKENYRSSKTDTQQGGSSKTNKQQHDPREDALYIKEAQIVGIHKTREDLIRWLIQDEEHPELGIVSVYGEGGLGKTTLVKKVFDSKAVTEHFPFRLWVTVSKTPDIKRLIQDLIKQVMDEKEWKEMIYEVNAMKTTKLKKLLHNHIRRKRYIVVLDDLWKLDAWRAFNNAFPDDINCGSRIMVTTRVHDVAHECLFENYSLALKLEPLVQEDALQLFCKKALSSSNVNSFPIHLRGIAEKFLQKCKGLPLAIVSIAGLLRTKDPIEWAQVYENLHYLIGSNEKLRDLSSILSFSYIDLPSHLKSCYLHLCIFPEDHSIKCTKLFRLWAAEGFVKRMPGMSSSMTDKDITRSYLDELINRSLVEAEEKDALGRAKTCRVHDVLRELILLKAREQDFLAHVEQAKEQLQSHMIGRRLSITNADEIPNQELLLKNKMFVSNLWSFFSFGEQSFSSTLCSTLFTSFRLLKVLELDDTQMGEFPSEISSLVYLKYLSINDGTLTNIPSSIGKLTMLEILYMKCSPIYQLPQDIVALKRLRYLVIGARDNGFDFPAGMESLTNLQKLSAVQANGSVLAPVRMAHSSDMLQRLGMLTEMRSLSVNYLKGRDGKQFLDSIEKMAYLRSLKVSSSEYVDSYEECAMKNYFHVDYPWSPPPRLRKLYMEGCLETCPQWFPKLQSLIKLTFHESKFDDDSFLKVIQTLPHLSELILKEAIDGKELYFEKEGFPSLKHLTLYYLRYLELVTVEEGAMPSIQKLSITHCGQLKKVPVGINHLSTLRNVQTVYLPHSFNDELKKQVWKHGHAPIISTSQ